MVDANGTVNTDIRDLYLGIYGALGAGQGKLSIAHLSLSNVIVYYIVLCMFNV